jgi:hypothetical protein
VPSAAGLGDVAARGQFLVSRPADRPAFRAAAPPMLIPLVIAAFFAGVSVAGLRSMERDIPKLIGEVNGILDSIATLAGASKS